MITLVKPGRDTFYLVDVARECGIDPKIARRKMRDRFGTLSFNGKGRWAFYNENRREVVEVIRRR